MAMQFFGHSVAAAMEHYKEKGIESLKNCLPTIMFIKRINKLIDAMNSQQPSDGLKPDPLSNHNSVNIF
ncbi:unnamed protein product [Macrosiphum euphorbiae]|uniref:Transposable element P transposase-like GTP-binding insertion domain-containing protein n=1 Tax=Macrosiphum euphorbiae TaxID=13131 RepID=A0AAV0XFB4_9HEMI|nr:unnamed protein product [Macrosiphum euphorbiae]